LVFVFRYSVSQNGTAHKQNEFFQTVDILDGAGAIFGLSFMVKQGPLGFGCLLVRQNYRLGECFSIYRIEE
jgi:hypothetical protein